MIGDPVVGAQFHDREDLLREILDGVDHAAEGRGRHLALIGPRKAGKTSLLLQVRRALADRADVQVIYLYLKPEPVGYLIRRALLALLSEGLRAAGLDVEEVLFPTDGQVAELTRRAVDVLPKTAGRVLELQDLGDPREAFVSLLSLFQVLQQECGRTLVVMLDEFQRLGGFGIRDVFDDFREVLSGQRDILYFVSGSAVGMVVSILSDSAAPLFGHFKLLQIGPFSYEDARAFLLDRLGGGVSLNASHLDFLIALTEGFPFYLDVLADRVRLLAVERKVRKASRSLVVDALARELFAETGTLYQHMRETVEGSIERRGLGSYLAILSAVASGNTGVAAIARAVGMQMPALPGYLRRLMEAGLIERQDRAYALTDQLLKRWLVWVYALREGSYAREVEAQLDYFKVQVTRMLNAYRAELGVAREAQIREIFSAMGGFAQVEGGMIAGEEVDLIARRADGTLWVGEVKTGPAGRAELRRFAQKCRAVSQQVAVERRILFALSGHDADLPDRARSEGIEVWGLEAVNRERRRLGLRPLRL